MCYEDGKIKQRLVLNLGTDALQNVDAMLEQNLGAINETRIERERGATSKPNSKHFYVYITFTQDGTITCGCV